MRTVSHDPTCRATVELLDGGRITAVELQWEFLRLAQKYADETGLDACGGDDVGGMVLSRWESVLTDLERDPMTARRPARLGHQALAAPGLHRPRRARVVRPQALAARPPVPRRPPRPLALREAGPCGQGRAAGRRRTRCRTGDRRWRRSTTRAWFRGGCLARWPDAVVAANWDSLILDVGSDPLRRIPMMEPLKGTKAHVQPLFDEVGTPAELVERLQG